LLLVAVNGRFRSKSLNERYGITPTTRPNL
jgi:hypothetical protein